MSHKIKPHIKTVSPFVAKDAKNLVPECLDCLIKIVTVCPSHFLFHGWERKKTHDAISGK